MCGARKALLALLMIVSVGLVGCGGDGSGLNPEIDGVVGPNVEFSGEYMQMSMVFKTLKLDGGLTLPIPEFPNSSLSIGPDFQSDGTLLTLAVSVKDFGVDDDLLDPTRLPGGRPLPGVASGELPAVALQIPQLFNTIFYVGKQIVGFFVPTDFLNLDVIKGAILTFKFHNGEGKRIGNLSLVGGDENSENAGILILINVDLELRNFIEEKKEALELAERHEKEDRDLWGGHGNSTFD